MPMACDLRNYVLSERCFNGGFHLWRILPIRIPPVLAALESLIGTAAVKIGKPSNNRQE